MEKNIFECIFSQIFMTFWSKFNFLAAKSSKYKGKFLYYVIINFEVSPPTHPNVSIRQHSKSTQPPTSLGKNSTHTQCVSKISAFLGSPKVPTYLKIDKKWLRNIKMFPKVLDTQLKIIFCQMKKKSFFHKKIFGFKETYEFEGTSCRTWSTTKP